MDIQYIYNMDERNKCTPSIKFAFSIFDELKTLDNLALYVETNTLRRCKAAVTINMSDYHRWN